MTELSAFFTGVALEVWRRVVPEDLTRAEVAFVLEKLRPSPGSRVLDVPSGFGRHALALAHAGLAVTAVDFAAEATADLERRAAAAGLPMRVETRDMRELDGLGTFDAALCLGNSFGYFDDAEQRRFVRAVSQRLRTGAAFLLDTSMAAETVLPTLQRRYSLDLGDITVHVENAYDVASSRLSSTYRFVERGSSGAVTERTLSHGVYTVGELTRMLAAAGLDVEERLVGTTPVPYALGAPRLLLVARKREALTG